MQTVCSLRDVGGNPIPEGFPERVTIKTNGVPQGMIIQSVDPANPDLERPCSPPFHQGCLAGPTVNSLTVVSSGMSSAKATTRAMRSGEMPNAA